MITTRQFFPASWFFFSYLTFCERWLAFSISLNIVDFSVFYILDRREVEELSREEFECFVADLKTIDLSWNPLYLSETYLLGPGSLVLLFLSEYAMASWDMLGLGLESLVLKFNYLSMGLMFLFWLFREVLDSRPPLR